MERAPGGRESAAAALAALAALLLVGGLLTAYASTAFFNSGNFADRATAALDDGAVRGEIASRVTDDVVINADANLVAVRPVIESVVSGLIGAQPFQAVFRGAAADLHRAIFEGDRNTVTLTLVDVGTVLRGALQAVKPDVAKRIPGGADVQVERIDPPSWLAAVLRAGDRLQFLRIALPLLALALAAVALALARAPRRAALRFGVALVTTSVLIAVALGAAETLLTRGIGDPQARDAARGIWDAFLGDLSNAMYLLAGAGAVVAAAASSLMRPVEIDQPLRRAGALLRTVPESTGARLARALALVVAGITIVILREAVLNALIITLGLFIAYLGVLELLRLADPAPEADGAMRREGRRALLAGGVAIAVIAIGAAVFTAGGGISEEPAAAASSGCNGSQGLCDRPLDDVAFASTHNAMSAATNPGWLFAQQERGISDQLNDGVRGLLIDAHYGVPTKAGTVKTDIGAELSADKIAETLGPNATEAAMRIRDRIVNSPETGPRQIYFCHGFCELGALPIKQVFGQIRDFLAANPGQVVIVVVEDYVKPEELAGEAKRAGLLDYIYQGPLDPVPTLGDVSASGGRAVFMAEHHDGGDQIPWYHSAYDSLVQETPYSFEQPSELLDPAKLTASCKPNRGKASAPLFLINHWIDTSPAPRPSNATQVNARKPLMRRVHHCERQRDLTANLIAVDFYGEGDLFGVVDELNGERAP